VTFKGSHRCPNVVGSGPQFFSELGQSITAEMALNQPATDMPIKFCDPALNGRLIDAQRLRSCLLLPARANAKKCLRSSHPRFILALCNFANPTCNLATGEAPVRTSLSAGSEAVVLTWQPLVALALACRFGGVTDED